MMRWMKILMFFAALAGSVTGTAADGAESAKAALTADFGPEGAWSNACEIDRMTDLKVCRLMSYRAFEEGGTQGFISLSVIPAGTDYHLFLTTSLGLIENCALRIDRQPRVETQIATINMCMFPNALSGKLLDQMRNGSTVLVRVNVSRGGRRDMDFSLNGFSRNFEEIQRNLH